MLRRITNTSGILLLTNLYGCDKMYSNQPEVRSEMKKFIVFALVAILCVLALTSCAKKVTTTVSVKIVGYEGEVIYEGTVEVTGEGATVMDAINTLYNSGSLTELVVTDSGLITSINGTKNSDDSSGEYYYYWRYKLNGKSEDDTVKVEIDGEMTESRYILGINAQPIVNNDQIVLEYVYMSIEDLEE